MEPPHVNGVSPCEGFPGTKVKIWGENLGIDPSDVLSVEICGHECIDTMEWVSERKIICESVAGTGRKGRVIITTTSGTGTCSVYFTALEPSAPQSPRLNPLQESDTWIEEDWDIFEDLGSGAHTISMDTGKARLPDPLGLHRGGAKQLAQEYIQQVCPNSSGDLLAENFNPIVYLLENHSNTSFKSLQQGLQTLREEVVKSEQAPGQFIRNNLDAFIQCYDTLSDVNELLIKNESESDGGSITDKLESLLQDTTTHADALFQGLLQRKEKADATRNALTVLQRYRFLFNLPHSIEVNIKNEEYEIVTNDYERAKSLFAGTKVNVFAKVLKQVESHVSKLISDLLKKLLQNPTTLDEQKRLIKYLLDLDYMGDPAWECIQSMHKWMLDMLFSCKKQFQSSDTALADSLDLLDQPSQLGHNRTASTISRGSSGRGSFKGTSHGKLPPGSPDFSKDQAKPKRILFVERLIDIVNHSLPNFCKLGQAYFQRSLFTTMLSENQDSIISDNISSKGSTFHVMVMEVAEIYTDMVNVALFADATSTLPEERVRRLGEWTQFEDNLMETSGPWLSYSVRTIRGCLTLLQNLQLPKEPLALIQQLAANVRMLCADTLFSKTAKDTEGLRDREDWRVQDDEGSMITSLPVLFENIVIDVLLTLKEIVIENHPGELEEHRKPLLQAATEHFQGILEDFIACLRYLAFPSDEETGSIDSGLNVNPLGSADDMLNKPSKETQLMLILSNCHYTKEYLCPRLFDCFISHGYEQRPSVRQDFLSQLDSLDNEVFEEYIGLKVAPIHTLIDAGVHKDVFNWETSTPPSELRGYLKETLLYLVHVHAEVYAISIHMTRRVLSRLVEELYTYMIAQLQEIETYSKQGILFAYVEVKTLEEILSPYISDTARRGIQAEYDKMGIDNLEKSDTKRVINIINSFKNKTDFQFRCFKTVVTVN